MLPQNSQIIWPKHLAPIGIVVRAPSISLQSLMRVSSSTLISKLSLANTMRYSFTRSSSLYCTNPENGYFWSAGQLRGFKTSNSCMLSADIRLKISSLNALPISWPTSDKSGNKGFSTSFFFFFCLSSVQFHRILPLHLFHISSSCTFPVPLHTCNYLRTSEHSSHHYDYQFWSNCLSMPQDFLLGPPKGRTVSETQGTKSL